ncbi:glutathione S-transferase family protein [Sphingomonas jatrophae]|uniref:glutathione transferase n=1 Tax=Sphingomonas jatrophae TaxID=1166337 RepID=A0A1I6M2X8_9SPHN|nr:glutathione S-transferase [Sphingomonas jatrophae]SFS10050.1 glutathione S-transferase [Sphingomonas jatrophae]
MIRVHHLETSRSLRILWLLEELGLPYEVRRYARNPKTMFAPAELRAIHPLGKAPLIEHDGRVIAESGAITEYLIELADGRLGAPANRDAALRYRHFLHYAEGSMMPPLLTLLVLQRMGLLGRPALGTVKGMIDTHLDWLETELAARPWFAGDDFTAADTMMSFPIEACRARAGLDGRRPHLIDWLERCHARPAYARAVEAGKAA